MNDIIEDENGVLAKEFLFIIGAPKSGTSWLQMMIGEHPAVCTTAEQTVFRLYVRPWLKVWRREADNIEQGRWVQGLPHLWSEEEFINFLKHFITLVYESMLALSPQATHILDKHPSNAYHVADINLFLPKARFIHIIRDGRDVATSMMAAKRNIGYGTSTVDASAAAWRNHVVAAIKGREYKERYLELRYEELLEDCVEVMGGVYDFCGLSWKREEISAVVEAHTFEKMKAVRKHADSRLKTNKAFYRKGKAGSWPEELSARDRYLFNKVAGDLLCELGYADPDWWSNNQFDGIWNRLLNRMPNRLASRFS